MLNYIKSRLLVFLPTLLGFLETALKLIKEILTLLLDVLYIAIPNAAFNVMVSNVRNTISKIYDWISKNKDKIIAILNAI